MRSKAISRLCKLAAVLAFAVPAVAEAADVPTYAELPIGSITIPPSANTSKPRSIKGADSLASDDAGFPRSECTTVRSDLTSVRGRDANRPLEWTSVTTVHHQGIALSHTERVLERDGGFVLESTDAWVDDGTSARSVISRATLPLRKVGSAPGTTIFAGRDERADGTRLVQFVAVYSPATPPSLRSWGSTQRSDGTFVPRFPCGHHRVSLIANGTGESAVMDMATMLPPLPAGSLPQAPPVARTPTFPQVRWRPLRIHVSISKTSRDKEPLVSVTSAWNGPESNPAPQRGMAVPPALTVDF